jgi:hypothetical protein
VVIVRHLDLSGQNAVDIAVVERVARRWATDHSRRRVATTALAARNFRYWAVQWLQWLGRLTVPAPIAPPPYHGLLDGFTTYLCESGG